MSGVISTGASGVDAQGDTFLYVPPNVTETLSGTSIVVPPGGNIQGAINQLPATGGQVTLSPNATYVVTSAITSNTPNVTISAPSWSTVIQRGPSLAGIMFQLNGSGCLIEGVTFDGNGTVNTSGQSEVQISGANSRITNCQVIRSAATINIAASGAGCRVDHCTITGLGIALSTERGSGVWADSGAAGITIDHNNISGTGLDAIDVAGGVGAVIEANVLTGCRTYLANPGGQIVVYPSSTTGPGTIVSNNVVGQGGGTATGGLELYGNNVTVTGNIVANQYGQGIGLNSGHGFMVSGNTVRNVGLDGSGSQDGIVVGAGVTDFVITGNRICDDQATPTMRWPISVMSGASDRYSIVGNVVVPNTQPNVHIGDGGTGGNKVIISNAGQASLQPYVYSAAALSIMPEYATFNLLNSGTLGITSIATSSLMYNTVKVALPNAVFTFTAGNNINNTVTTVANVPLLMVCDGTGHWWLK